MNKFMWLGAAAAIGLAAAPVQAAEIKIGFVTTLTGPSAVIGNDMRNAVELALQHINKKMGPLDVSVIYGDDEQNPQKGKQAVEKLVERDNVDIVAGEIWSNVLLATKDLDGTFERLQASDVEIVQEPTEQPYGVRDCAVRDPAGTMVRIQEQR